MDSLAGEFGRHPIGYSLWLLAAAFACIRGDAPERWGGGVLAANVIASLITGSTAVHSVFWNLFGEDAVVLVAFVVLLARYERKWLIWAVGIQACAVISHLPRIFDPTIRNLGYATLEAVLGYGVVAIVTLGTLRGGRDDAARR